MSGVFEEDDDVDEGPKGNQGEIIETDDFPMRVLAGAGTGKTFTMVRKVEHLLRTEQTSPQNVLALTFTNKAADSMRRKLNARLDTAGYDIDAYTYHSICHSILKEYPYYADLPSGFTVASDADKFELAENAVEEIEYQFVNPDGSYRHSPPEALLNFISSMKQEGVRPADLETYLPSGEVLVELNEMADRIETAARNHLRRQSLRDGADAFCDDLETFALELQLEQKSLGTSPLEEDIGAYLQQLIETTETIQARIRTDSDAIDHGAKQAAVRIPAVLFSGYGSEGNRMTRKSDFPTGIPKLPFTLIDRLRTYLEDCQRAADFVTGYRAYETQRLDSELVDFDDLIHKAVELLRDDDLAAEIAGQWDYVFCDEFQDTDSIQFELVEALAKHNRLFVVGDDDQAIYEWRGANSENIGSKLTATYQPNLIDKELDLNFRSKQPILNLANDAITALEDRRSDKQLTAFGKKRDATDGVAYIDTSPPDGEDALDDDEYQANQITTAIAGLLRGDFDPVEESYDLEDIAILVRKNRHAEPLIQSFGEAGIPFELVGDLATESVGVETVLAYLRAIAAPSDDVSVRRVLLMRYRLSEADLRLLADSADRLIDAVFSANPSELSEPERFVTARDHFHHLFSRRHLLSVQQLYHELLHTTDIEWFLTHTERRELKGLEELIAEYGDGTSQPPLDADFLDYLDHHDSITDVTDSAPNEQGESASDAVSIMTIHKAKGLDFPVVVMPELTADQWAPRARSYADLVEAVNGCGFWEADQIKRDQQEARRLLHVGITRAEEQLILCGHGEAPETPDEGVTLDYIQRWIGDGIRWDVSASSFPVWEQIQESLPASAQDWTELVSEASPRQTEAVATYDGGELTYQAAVETVLDQADRLLNGTLSDGEPASINIQSDAFTTIETPSIRRSHSYTSLGTVEDCARKHYLDHVVYAPELPRRLRPSVDSDGSETDTNDAPSVTATDTGASNREIGVLFHETAEAAIDRNRTERSEWREICEQLAVERGLEQALEDALDCVDRFFQTPVADWTLLSAEHSFGIEIEDYYVVGEIDCLARRPDGELVVLDYKATESAKGETNRQLPLYILACEELFEESITTAGYVYVGDVGPDIDLRTYDDDRLEDARTRILGGLQKANTSSYADYTTGEHCKWCPHNELPCSGLHGE
ncbi:ATP-dependent helicase [Haloplanus rubicundus]|uniref:DNA 3'-5' helicase n=1 Tax=Haloplanus rubicundus TaxID=1547898 RepID=A0A345E8C1_9EURY|nr:ATP-dependent DNA helicase [Haloplanus rubicundus]AXG08443.1 ATP-dependent helicase [Haloplanus rubicundus]